MAHWRVLCITLAVLAASFVISNQDSDPKQLSSVNTDFSIQLYKALRDISKSGNLFFSPFSISSSLAMAYLGARGTTETQMAEVLKFQSLQKERNKEFLFRSFKDLLDILNSPGNNYTLAIANRFYGADKFQFEDKYVQDTDRYFGASLESLDFAKEPEISRAHINSWIANKTMNKLENMLPTGTINAMTVLVLVNAIYFKGLWMFPFRPKDTKPTPFNLGLNVVEDIPMMHIQEYYRYADMLGLGAKLLEMPYAGGDVSMVILLPDAITGLPYLEDNLDIAKLDHFLGISKVQRVKVTLPRFKMNMAINLKRILGNMGLVNLFSSGICDLTGISRTAPLMVSEIVHKTFLEVNEDGSEAAGVLTVHNALVAVREIPLFTVDRPFMFFIRESKSGAMLFMGRVSIPPEDADNIGTFGEGFDTDDNGTKTLSPSFCILLLLWTLSFITIQQR